MSRYDEIGDMTEDQLIEYLDRLKQKKHELELGKSALVEQSSDIATRVLDEYKPVSD